MTAPVRPNPAAQSAQRSYQDELDHGRLRIQCCGACGHNNFPPRELCPGCGSPDLKWLQPSGGGTVYAVTTVRRKPEAGGDYNVSLIDLDESVRMMSRVEGVAPSDVRIGIRVSARILQQAGRGLVVFDPLEEPAP
jgi:uncharacterized OB-fold protein